MAARSIATLSISFGLVSIPVKVYLATEPAAAVRFKLMGAGGVRVRQQYVAPRAALPGPESDDLAVPPAGRALATQAGAGAAGRAITPPRGPEAEVPFPAPPSPAWTEHELDELQVVPRSAMVRGYEVEKGKFVLFTEPELRALAAQSRQTIDIVSFVPHDSVDPIYYDKAYYLAPADRQTRPYSLLHRAMVESGHCALAKWAWRAKEYVVQLRPIDGGLVLQQLLYADEVRPFSQLGVELSDVGEAELSLAVQLIGQAAVPAYDPSAFIDEEKQRILAAVERKLKGREAVTPDPVPAQPAAGNVVDLVAALRASLAPRRLAKGAGAARENPAAKAASRKPARRAPATPAATIEPRRRRGGQG